MKMIKLPTEIYRFNTVVVTIPTGFFFKMILKWIWKDKKKRIDKIICKKNNKVRELQYSMLRLIYGYSQQIYVVLAKG